MTRDSQGVLLSAGVRVGQSRVPTTQGGHTSGDRAVSGGAEVRDQETIPKGCGKDAESL